METAADLGKLGRSSQTCHYRCEQPSLTVATGVRFHVPYEIQVEGAGDIQTLIDSVFKHIDSTYNNWNPHSEVSRLNQLPAYTPFRLSDDLHCFLLRIDAIVKETGGAFDPTIGHWSQVHFEEGVFWKESEVILDLCGCAKGYAVDLLVETLQEADYTNILVNWGGDIRAEGNHPSGRPWKIAIAGQEESIDLQGAIATSGQEHQHHLYDPKTGALIERTDRSVTVKEKTCFRADALATALSVDSSLNLIN